MTGMVHTTADSAGAVVFATGHVDFRADGADDPPMEPVVHVAIPGARVLRYSPDGARLLGRDIFRAANAAESEMAATRGYPGGDRPSWEAMTPQERQRARYGSEVAALVAAAERAITVFGIVPPGVERDLPTMADQLDTWTALRDATRAYRDATGGE